MATHDYVSVIEHTSVVLRDDAQNTKALLRRGAAYEKSGMYEQACADMEVLLANDSTLTDARVALERLRALAAPAARPPAPLDEAPTAQAAAAAVEREARAAGHEVRQLLGRLHAARPRPEHYASIIAKCALSLPRAHRHAQDSHA